MPTKVMQVKRVQVEAGFATTGAAVSLLAAGRGFAAAAVASGNSHREMLVVC